MQDFFQNVSRYPRYLISLILGIFWSFFGWLKPKNTLSAIALVGFLVGGFAFLYLTLSAMLGLN